MGMAGVIVIGGADMASIGIVALVVRELDTIFLKIISMKKKVDMEIDLVG